MSEADESGWLRRMDARAPMAPDGAAVRRRAPWRAPKVARVPIRQTLLGGSVGNEGNGVFAFFACV